MDDHYINTTAIFGEVKRNVLSKDFKFGKLTNVFARTTIDFCNADINGAVVLETSQLCGEIRIKAPADWRIVSKMFNVLMEVKDQRRNPIANPNNQKTLILEGGGIFAAVTIMDCQR